MCSQNRKTIITAIATIAIAVTSLGGVANGQNVVNTQNVPQPQEYQFPPSNAVPQYQAKSAPVASRTRQPLVRQPVRAGYTPRPAPYQIRSPRPYAPPRAQQYRPAPYANPNLRPMSQPVQRPVAFHPAVAPRPAAQPYAMPYNNRPAYAGSGPYGNPYNQRSQPYPPYNNSYNHRSSNKGPFDQFGGGPFNSNNPPWEEWPFGAPDSFWNRKENPFKEQNPTDWFQPEDPKEGMAVMWDDLIAAPDDLGTMPGGWTVPSVRVPNPVDLEDQLERASKEIPDLIEVYTD